MEGTVKWFNNAKGYGLIERDGKPDVFVHYSDIQSDVLQTLDQREVVQFHIRDDPPGPRAVNVKRTGLIRERPPLPVVPSVRQPQMKVVIDTNTLVRAAFNTHRYLVQKYGGRMINVTTERDDPEWRPMRILDMVGGRLALVTSPILKEEALEVFERQNPQDATLIECVRRVTDAIADAIVVVPTMTLSCCRDPDDDRVLECALEGRVDAIISADDDLLSMGNFQGIPIVDPDKWADWLSRHHGPPNTGLQPTARES